MNSGKKNELERLWKLQTSANQLVLEGKRKPDALAELLQGFVFGNILTDIDWWMTYERLGMEKEYGASLAALAAPAESQQLWAVPMVMGFTCNKVVAAFRRDKVQVYVYEDDLDAELNNLSRDLSKGSYFVGFRRTVEADEENNGKSANVLAKENHQGITLLERLVLGYGYYVTTGQHLDVENVTLCAGSRDSDGFVPRVHWSSGSSEVYVYWNTAGGGLVPLRSRSAVSFAGEAPPSQQ